MTLLTKRKIILMDIEDTYRVPKVLNGANHAVCVQNPSVVPSDNLIFESNATKGGEFGKQPARYVGGLWEFKCDVPLAGSGALGVAPEISKLWRICGMTETVNAGVDVQYGLSSALGDSATIAVFEDGKKTLLAGCRGIWTMQTTIGEGLVFSFTIWGHLITRVDEILPTATYIDSEEIVFVNAALTQAATDLDIENYSLDIGNVVSKPKQSGSTNGYGEIIFTDRNVSGGFDPTDQLLADRDDIGLWIAGTKQLLELGPIGNSAGNRALFTCNDTFYEEVAPGDRDGIMINEINFGCAAGDNSLVITMT